MKQNIFLSLLFAGVIWGCSESTSTSKKDGSSQDQFNTCNGNAYFTTPPCPGYCQNNPTASGCSGTTTGSTTSGTTSGSTTGSTSGGSGGGNYSGIPDSNNEWGSLYNSSGKPNASTAANCSAPVNQPGGTNYSPRKGSIHMAFGKNYRPDLPGLSNYSTNISYFLTTVDSAKGFLDSDGSLKVRFMPRPQRVPAAGKEWCYGRRTGSGSGAAYGYTELIYSVGVYGIQNGTLVGPIQTHYLTTAIQSCSPAINFTGLNQSYPEGIVISVYDVQSNQGCGSHPCSGNLSAATTTCWGMDIEVATDSTKTF